MNPTISRLLALTCATAATVTVLTGSATQAAVSPGTGSSANVAPQDRPGLSRLLSAPPLASGQERAIVTFAAPPGAAQVAALRELGLVVQPLTSVPLALVAGPRDALVAAADIGRDVYPDERLTYFDTASSNAMSSTAARGASLRAKRFTGRGTTVGIVDSGCDGTHPDLADHIDHNVTLVSPEYVNQDTDPMLVIPTDRGPYNNTDLGSGHGTHVAGIIAADGTSGPDHLGVAPDAELVCFAIGAVITTTAVVTAYDYALSQPDMLGIDVFNNSWGNSFRQYDPNDPVNLVTKEAADHGAVVVFAAGNSGSEEGEASVSPFNQAPWVLSVAAGTLGRQRGEFSSNGLQFDNGRAAPIGDDGHTVFTGDRIGNTQPDLMAPGVNISSSCASTGTVIGPCPQHGNETASGTSMASPHVAGAAAVLRQIRPGLTWRRVQIALTATASPVWVEGGRLSSAQVGYGHVNLDRAVAVLRSSDFGRQLADLQASADARLLRQDAYKVTRSDLWQEASPPVVAGGSYSATHQVSVGSDVTALKVTLVYPTPGTVANLARFEATVKDPSGRQIAATVTDIFYTTGVAHVLVPVLRSGTYTIEVTGQYTISDPDTIDSDSINGRVVFLQAAQLARR